MLCFSYYRKKADISLHDLFFLKQDFLGNVKMTACEDGSFCCGQENKTCCDRKQGTRLAATIGVSASTIMSNSTSTSSLASTSTSTPASGATTSTSEGVSTPAKVGIAIGVSVSTILLLCLAGWYFLRRRKRRPDEKNDDDSYWSKPELSAIESTRPPSWPGFDRSTTAHEIDGQPTEMPVCELGVGRPSSNHNPIQ